MAIDLTVPTVKGATKRADYLRLLNNVLAVTTEYFPTQAFRGLQLRTSQTDVEQLHLTGADEIVMSDGSRLGPWPWLTADIGASGANGLDTGAPVNSTWYEIHAVAKDDDTKALLLHRSLDWFDDESQTATDTQTGLNSAATNQQIAQEFQVDTAGEVPFVDLDLIAVGSPSGTFWLEIQGDSGGLPDGTALATSEVQACARLTTSAQRVRLVFPTRAMLAAATAYHLVLRGDYATSGNYVAWKHQSTDVYARGSREYYDGATWSNQTGDMCFHVYVERNKAALTLPSGYTKSALIGFVYRNSSGSFDIFTQSENRVTTTHMSAIATTATVPTFADLAALVPPRSVLLRAGFLSSIAGDAIVASACPDGFYANGMRGAWVIVHAASLADLQAQASFVTHYQALYAYRRSGTGTCYTYRVGYEW